MSRKFYARPAAALAFVCLLAAAAAAQTPTRQPSNQPQGQSV